MAIASLQPGYRFHPTDIELVVFYLKRKVKNLPVEAIVELNIYLFSPWDLPDISCLESKDREWYFFSPRERKYANGPRMNRATETGYWKTTGKDRTVFYNDRIVGMVKTLVFYEGNAPKGNRTDWVIHEYRLEDKNLADSGVVQDSFVLCKVFQKSGPGPKNGAPYGAHFQEEDWGDDNAVVVTPILPSEDMSPPVHLLPETQNFSLATGMVPPGRGDVPLIVETRQSQVSSYTNNGYRNFPNYTMDADMVDPGSEFGLSLADLGVDDTGPVEADDDDITHMLDAFYAYDLLLPHENYNVQRLRNLGHGNDARANPFRFDQAHFLLPNNTPFIELADLDPSYNQPDPSSGSLYEPFRPFHELPVLPDELVHPLVFPQTVIGYNDHFPEGAGSIEQYYSASNSQPGNIGGDDEEIP